MIESLLEALQFSFMRHALLAGLLVSIACGIIGTPDGWWDDHYTSRQQLTLSADPPLLHDPATPQVVAVTLDTQALITDSLMLSSGRDLRVVYRDNDTWHELPRRVL